MGFEVLIPLICSHGRRQRPKVEDGTREELGEGKGCWQGKPARIKQEGDDNPVQGVHADIYVHYIRGEVQGTCRSKAPQIRCYCLLPPSQKLNKLIREKS
nr:hypothetical protein CFP56_51412 [Quercus suber]